MTIRPHPGASDSSSRAGGRCPGGCLLVIILGVVMLTGGVGGALEPLKRIGAGTLRHISSEKPLDIKLAVILPMDNRWGFSMQRVLPAISLALDRVRNMTMVHRLTLHVNHADSKCHIAEAINQAFNFFMEKEVSVILGPACDYAAAPVARQLTYWNLPLITAGAMASDFGLMKKSTYPLVTRVGANINSLARVIFAILDHFKWSKVKLVYNPDGQGDIAEKFCHFTADGLHRAFLTRQLWGKDFEQDYFKFMKWSDFGNKMPSEIGLEYSGN